jgi:hypothetical protein
VARDRDIIIKSFSAGQTNTRAEKGFRMSKLLNVELDNFGDSISSNKHLFYPLYQYYLEGCTEFSFLYSPRQPYDFATL